MSFKDSLKNSTQLSFPPRLTAYRGRLQRESRSYCNDWIPAGVYPGLDSCFRRNDRSGAGMTIENQSLT